MKQGAAKATVRIISLIGVVLAALSAAASIVILSVGTQFNTLMLTLAGAGLVFSVAQIVIYANVLMFKHWARIAAIILGVLGILTVPIGTFFGMAVIYFFRFDKGVKQLFAK